MNILKTVQDNSRLSVFKQLLSKSSQHKSEAVKTKAHLEFALRGATKA